MNDERDRLGAMGDERPGALTSIAQAAGHDEKARRARAVVSLELLKKPFVYAAMGVTSLLAMLWRLIMRVLRRIAGLHNVALNAPEGPSHAGSGGGSGYEGESTAAAQAAAQATETLRADGDFASSLAQDAGYRQQLQGEGSRAYLRLALQRLGADIAAADAELAAQRACLTQVLAPIAARTGVPAQELSDMLMRPQLAQSTLALDVDLPAAREQALRVAHAAKKSEQLRELFVDHCASAVDPQEGDPDGEIAAIVRQALERAADPTLTESVQQIFAFDGRTPVVQDADKTMEIGAADGSLHELNMQPKAHKVADFSAKEDHKQNSSGVNSQNGFSEANAPSVKSPVPLRRFAVADVGETGEPCEVVSMRERAG